MITDTDLDRESPEDEPMLLAHELGDRLKARASRRELPAYGYGLRAISELIYKVSADNPGNGEATAQQLENMADYVRKNMR